MTSSATPKASSQDDASRIDPPETGSKGHLSREIIKRKFIDAGCLVTIGLDHIIIGPEATDRFQRLMEMLRKAESDTEGMNKPLLAWITDAGETTQEKEKARHELKRLQSCLQKLEKQTADWLRDRAIFVVAHADKSWIEQSALADKFPLDEYHASKASKADDFFNSIRKDKNKLWRTADVITAFPYAKNPNATKFYRHDAPDEEWKKGPMARMLRSKAGKRNSLVRRLCRLRQSESERDSDPKTLSKFFDRGFAIFKLEEVIDIDI